MNLSVRELEEYMRKVVKRMNFKQARLIAETFAELDESIVDYKDLMGVLIKVNSALGLLISNHLKSGVSEEEIEFLLNEIKTITQEAFEKSRTDLQIHTRH